jgi:activator of 2-hydroxyglutaryl-CoA dehydratase/predicted nucleotide-binding protein (sugar kinase/HSP70/actin superfamily)
MKERKKIGICTGSATVTLVIRRTDGTLENVIRERHLGNPKKCLDALLNKHTLPSDTLVVTGRTKTGKYISEPEAVQKVLDGIVNKEYPRVIVSFGGQSIMAYEVSKTGQIIESHTFNKCGSGTGEFFLQQIQRLGFKTIEEAIAITKAEASSLEKPYVPASRCSVFCKSDITHACNEKKATTGQIVMGFCKMIAEKISELISKVDSKNIWIIGGGTEITPIIDYLRLFGFTVLVPEEATYFEANGASLIALEDKLVKEIPVIENSNNGKSFPVLPPLSNFKDLVVRKKVPRVEAQKGEKVLLSIDVGSTSTKMVLSRLSDLSIVSDYYGYTLGKPNEAVLVGLKEILIKLKVPVTICGISVTGSGRYLIETFLTNFSKVNNEGKVLNQAIAINEILCHAKAAEYFNPGVSVVLEIGGQDAKYTLTSNGVAIDYCMNEACSAGTGSFLAEVINQQFGISDPSKIAPIAILAENPIQFGEQCSAFIESDIATALQEENSKEDIIAGLCYSICYNYINRVVGNRPINGTISIQGGTAYNEAFCLAMAGVLKMSNVLQSGNKIVVSDDAGLMGALGGSIVLKEKIESGEFLPFETTLEDLLKKELLEGKSFICKSCDYHCDIRNFIVDGKKVPFGGFCRRWENVRKNEEIIDPDIHNMVKFRDEQLFNKFSNFGEDLPAESKTIGMTGSFFELTYLPFFTNLFVKLGYKPVLADEIDKDGVLRQGAAFCWPVEVMHGLFANLIKKQPNFYWLPQLKSTSEKNIQGESKHTCPFVQGIPYVLGTAFSEISQEKILKPYLELSEGTQKIFQHLLTLKDTLGFSEAELSSAIEYSWDEQIKFFSSLKKKGNEILNWLKEDNSRIAFVLVGRPYNAFSAHLNLNKGIAMKIASMGIPIIPLDFLPYHEEGLEEKMYWSTGQMILRGGRFIAKHPQLFPVFLTNFSCGPDSFINFKFREYMGSKPSLTLEFDGHTANAGFDTRIEAFISIVNGYFNSKKPRKETKLFQAAKVESLGTKTYVIDSMGKKVDLKNPRVHLIIPDMGRYTALAQSAAAGSMGIRSSALPPADEECLALGRRYSSCKECLPYNLTLGSLLKYVNQRTDEEELTVFFMPDTTGPCRFGQYNIFIKGVIEKLMLENVAVITLSSKNAYSGMGNKFAQRSLIAVAIGMSFMNISNALRSIAKDPENAELKLQKEWEKIEFRLSKGISFTNFFRFQKILKKSAQELSAIQLKKNFANTPKVLITGEIYARVAKLTTDPLVQFLSDNNFIPVFESILNWFKYEDEMISQGFSEGDYKKMTKVGHFFHRGKIWIQSYYEKKIVKILSSSGLISDHVDDIHDFLEAASPHFSKMLTGEAILTIGSSLSEVFDHYAGVAVLGPFGCMPSRIATGILQHTMTAETKLKLQPENLKVVELAEQFERCPVVFIETDGGPLPFITQSKLEVFALVAGNVGKVMTEIENRN